MTQVHPYSRLADPYPSREEAAVLTAPRRWAIQPAEVPSPAPGEVTVRIEGCGVCASSLPAWQGRDWFSYPMSPGKLGHEGWGRIIAVGEAVSPDRIGERVAMLADGAFATHLCVPAAEVCTVPEGLEGWPVPAEPIACAFAILKRADVEGGTRVAVVGSGFLGTLLIQLLSAQGCEVTTISRRDFALETARAMGARRAIRFGAPWEVEEQLGERFANGFPRVIEAVGNQEALSLASSLVAAGGKLVIAGYHQDGLRSVNLQEWNWKGIDVINAHERCQDVLLAAMRRGLDVLARGGVDLRALLTHRYRPDQIDRAFSDLEERPAGFLKGWIDFSYSSIT